jgi:hypothetical protein
VLGTYRHAVRFEDDQSVYPVSGVQRIEPRSYPAVTSDVQLGASVAEHDPTFPGSSDVRASRIGLNQSSKEETSVETSPVLRGLRESEGASQAHSCPTSLPERVPFCCVLWIARPEHVEERFRIATRVFDFLLGRRAAERACLGLFKQGDEVDGIL